MTDSQQFITETFIDHRDRALASLINSLGDIDLAEDVLQDAFTVALTHWSENGIPPNPVGWLIVTARRKALDRLRRDRTYQNKLQTMGATPEIDSTWHEALNDPIPDERLKLIFMCCHPALKGGRCNCPHPAHADRT